MEVKQFDSEDWWAFGGAENFKDGVLPLIGLIQLTDLQVGAVVVADLNGIQVHFEDAVSDRHYLLEAEQIFAPAVSAALKYFNFALWTQAIAQAFLEGIPSAVTLEDLRKMGFIQI